MSQNETCPNHEQLKTFARKYASYNNYTVLTGYDLYYSESYGVSKDSYYGELGVASASIELGKELNNYDWREEYLEFLKDNFFRNCDDFEKNIFPENVDSLIYAIKAARAPYKIVSHWRVH